MTAAGPILTRGENRATPGLEAILSIDQYPDGVIPDRAQGDVQAFRYLTCRELVGQAKNFAAAFQATRFHHAGVESDIVKRHVEGAVIAHEVYAAPVTVVQPDVEPLIIPSDDSSELHGFRTLFGDQAFVVPDIDAAK